MSDLIARLGRMDIYLLDQWMRGRLRPEARILDAGCGGGRNIAVLLREGFDVTAVDQDPFAVESVIRMMGTMGIDDAAARARVASVDALPFGASSFDVVISNAVLHFADGPRAFEAMLREMARVLRPGGLFFARLASSIGIETRVEALGGGRFRLPDGSDRYLVDEATLLRLTASFPGTLLDPLKTTNVQGLRCMTTWVLRKSEEA